MNFPYDTTVTSYILALFAIFTVQKKFLTQIYTAIICESPFAKKFTVANRKYMYY